MPDEPVIRVESDWRGCNLSNSQVERLKAIGEEAFQAELLGLSMQEVREFVAAQGVIECGSRTKSGTGCRRVTAAFLNGSGRLPRDGEVLFQFDEWRESPRFISAAIRCWQKHKALGVSCYLHGGDRGVADFDGKDIYWPKERREEKAEAGRVARKQAKEERLASDLENPAEPSWGLVTKLGHIAIAQFDRLDFSAVTDPDVLRWHEAMLARNKPKD